MPKDLEDCPCEDYEVEDACFGKLCDGETLSRIIPQDAVLENGGVPEMALPTKKFLKKKKGGWSFVRHDYVNMECAIKRHAKNKGKNKKFCYANIKTSDIRTLRSEEGRRQVCVFANPLEGNPDHALAHSKHRDFKPSDVRVFRDVLLKKFNKINNGE